MVTTTGRLVFGGSGPAEQQDDDDKLQQLAKEEGNRSKAVAELLSTEKTFVSEMTLLVEVFLEPLRRYGAELAAEAEAAAEDRADAGKARLAVTPEDLTVIFSNVEQLLGFNRSFLADLEAAMAAGGQGAVVEVFLKAAPFMRMFSVYVNNFDRAREALAALRTRPQAHAFLRACEGQRACRGHTLPDFLIQPVQRIPRYRLLLETILKYTPAEDALQPRLKEALVEVSQVATKINKDVHTREAQDKMLQLQAEFGAQDFLEPGRQFVLEGDLIKITRGGRKEHKFVLFNDKLVYGEEKGLLMRRTGMFANVVSGNTKRQYRKAYDFPLSRGLYVVNDVGGAYASARSGGGGGGAAEGVLGDTGFMFITPDKSFVVHAASPAEKDAWVQALRRVMADLTAKGDSRALKVDMDLSDKVKPAKSGKSISCDIFVWVIRDGKTMRQGFSLPPSALSAPFGVLSYSELVQRGAQVDPSPTRAGLPDDDLGFGLEWDAPPALQLEVLPDPFDDDYDDPLGGSRLQVEVSLQPGDRLGLRLRDIQGGGVLVMGFITRGCAAQVAGVCQGDRVTHIDGTGPLLSAAEAAAAAAAALDRCGGGGVLKLTLRRGFALLSAGGAAPLALTGGMSSVGSHAATPPPTPHSPSHTASRAGSTGCYSSNGTTGSPSGLGTSGFGARAPPPLPPPLSPRPAAAAPPPPPPVMVSRTQLPAPPSPPSVRELSAMFQQVSPPPLPPLPMHRSASSTVTPMQPPPIPPRVRPMSVNYAEGIAALQSKV